MDFNPANDVAEITLRNIPTIREFPYEESFEHGQGSWITGGRSTSWQLGSPNAAWINAAGDGQKAWVTNLNGQYSNSEFSFLESPCFDFSTLTVDPILSFLHTFELEEEADQSWVEYRVNGEKEWKKLGITGSGISNWYNYSVDDTWSDNALAGPNEWQMAAHPLKGMAGQSVRFRFVLKSDNNFAYEGVGVDKIRISLPYDVGVSEILSPRDTCGVSSRQQETVCVKVKKPWLLSHQKP